jgi:hypothetical protein
MSFPSDSATRSRLVKALLADESPLRHAQSGFATGQFEPRRAALIRALLQGGGRRSGYDPNQPRVPAGNPDGGQWTSTGGARSSQHVMAERSSVGGVREALIRAVVEMPSWGGVRDVLVRAVNKPPGGGFYGALIWAAIEAFRAKELLKDLLGDNIGVVARTEINGEEVFGVNGQSPNFTGADDKAAKRLRRALLEKYPKVMSTHNIGQWPNDALFHAETTALLRAAEKNGGTLAGQSLEVYVDEVPCPHCKRVLPYVALELGNPTVTFVDPKGGRFTIRDGKRVRPR